MTIQILSYEPKLAQNGTPDSFTYSGKTYFPYVVTYSMDGQQYQGEANVMSTPPWWEIGATYEVTTTQDDNRVGGHKLTFVRPPQQHTGGSRFQKPSQTPQQTFNTPQATVHPNFQQPQQSASPPKQEPQSGPTNEDFRQALIVSQTSMKVAGEYIPTLSEIEKQELLTRLGTEEDLVAAFADKIARETYKIATSLLQHPPF